MSVNGIGLNRVNSRYTELSRTQSGTLAVSLNIFRIFTRGLGDYHQQAPNYFHVHRYCPIQNCRRLRPTDNVHQYDFQSDRIVAVYKCVRD